MPRATTGRQDTALVQLGSDGPHAGEPLRSQDGPQVRRTVPRLRPDCSYYLPASQRPELVLSDSRKPVDSFPALAATGGSREGAKCTSGVGRVTAGLMVRPSYRSAHCELPQRTRLSEALQAAP
jgi:hypothetical protein